MQHAGCASEHAQTGGLRFVKSRERFELFDPCLLCRKLRLHGLAADAKSLLLNLQTVGEFVNPDSRDSQRQRWNLAVLC